MQHLYSLFVHTLSGHLINSDTHLMSHKSDNTEYDKPGKHTGATIAHRYKYGVLIEVVVKSVITGQGD